MLVRFLSFIASLIGTGRYKTVLLSCLVLVLSLTSFTYLIFHGSGGNAQDASSSTVRQKDGLGTQSFAPQLGSNRKQETKPQLQTTQSGDSSTNTNTTKNSPQPTTGADNDRPQNQQAAFDFTLNVSNLTLAAGSTSDPITASTSDNTAVNWQVATDNDAFAHVTLNQSNTAAASLEVQTTKDAPTGKPITITLTARDATRNINLSKSITVTIQ
ncbi:MAG TPA: hypothetical protein VIR03_00545 [Candidatus Saccharimonadales bacterium]